MKKLTAVFLTICFIMGLTACDKNKVRKELVNSYKVGVYSATDENNTRSRLVIHKIKDNEITFSVRWARVNSIDYATVKITNGEGQFTWKKEYANECVAGKFEFVDRETIAIKLTESTLVGVNAETYYYEYFGTEEESQAAYNKSVLLDLQSESRGWIRYDETEFGKNLGIIIRFNYDGSMIYWVGKSLGGSTTFEDHEATYKVTSDRLYINDCAYSLYAYTAGDTIMSLKALGDYETDFSGDYVCEIHDMCEWLFSEIQMK